ncbi:MAG: restriction endonuclease subunit S, partial [Cyclobacteriaceae bacterium]
ASYSLRILKIWASVNLVFFIVNSLNLRLSSNYKPYYFRGSLHVGDGWYFIGGRTASTGSTAKGINQKSFKKVRVKIPVKEEQQKIASFLTVLDAEIESVATQIAHTQTFKKGLLQQMFV